MKLKRLTLLTTAMLLVCGSHLKAQQEQPIHYPIQQSSVSVYASSLLLASVLNLSYERLWKPAEDSRVRYGFTTGYTLAVQHWDGGFEELGMGPHLAFTLLAGRKEKYFELKLGGVAIFERYGQGIELAYPMPVISLGYRKQYPETSHFIRFGLSTAGFGFGVGFLI